MSGREAQVPVPDSPRLGAQDKRGARVCPHPCPWETRGNRKHDALWLALRTRAVALAIKTRLHVTLDPQPKVMEQVPVTLGEGLSLTPWSALTPRRDQTRTSRPADAQLGARAGAESPCSPTRRPGPSHVVAPRPLCPHSGPPARGSPAAAAGSAHGVSGNHTLCSPRGSIS